MFQKESIMAKNPPDQDADKIRNFSTTPQYQHPGIEIIPAKKLRTDQELSMLCHTRVLLSPGCNKFIEKSRDSKSKQDETVDDYPSFLSDYF